jgi:hypothetical protein
LRKPNIVGAVLRRCLLVEAGLPSVGFVPLGETLSQKPVEPLSGTAKSRRAKRKTEENDPES